MTPPAVSPMEKVDIKPHSAIEVGGGGRRDTSGLYIMYTVFLSFLFLLVFYGVVKWYHLLLLVRQMETPVLLNEGGSVYRRSLRLPYSLRATGV